MAKWWGRLRDGRAEKNIQLVHKELFSDRGFLVYVTRTYLAMIPYLKGFHLTIEMWRGGRDSEGWKLRDGEVIAIAQDQSLDSWTELDDPSSAKTEDKDMAGVNHRIGVKRGNVGVHAPANGFTTPVPRFKKDIAALMCLTDFDLPPL